MPKVYPLISAIVLLVSLVVVSNVQAAGSASPQEPQTPDISISTPSYPIGMRSGESQMIPYHLKEANHVSGEIVSRTLQFFTQYGDPLNEPMGPYPTRIAVKSSQTTAWNELVYLPRQVFEKARARDEYAVILKTTFRGESQSGADFTAQSSLLVLFPPAPFVKITPENKASDTSTTPFLNWSSSIGAVDYEYCFDTIDNDSCDTNWTGTYWVGTYESKVTLQNLPHDTTFYWQVRANNMAGTTYANHGRWWSFTTCSLGPLTVTSTGDSGEGSLRQALAHICPGGMVKFAPALAGQTISLSSHLVIDKTLTVDGSGLAPQVIISGADQAHIEIQDFGGAPTVTFTDLTIAHGYSSGTGGAIFANAPLILVNSTLQNNHALGAGGAIYSTRPLTLTNSTLIQNKSDSDGGALALIGLANGSKIVNSTIADNQAAGAGGGILMMGNTAAEVLNSTFARNTALSGKEFRLNGNTSLSLDNTIFVCADTYDNCYRGLFVLSSHSILGLGTLTDFGLEKPRDNGGPTLTMALHLGSPAINAGDDTSCPVTDQRGVARPYGSHCDIGAFEFQKQHGSDTTGVFRPGNGALYLKNSNAGGFADLQINYGMGGDTPIVADWDGDGVDTIGIYRSGSFYLRDSNTTGFADLVFPFGLPGDQPITGDWNGDGTDTIGVYRASTGTFFLRDSNSAGAPDKIFQLGIPGDVGIAGDWDGDGFDTTGVFRPANGILFLKNTNSTGFADLALHYGIPGDKPLTGDWNNDGKDTIGVYRNGTFYLRNSNTIGYADIVFKLGIPGDLPIAGNWDGLP